jgi:hypothetical protein
MDDDDATMAAKSGNDPPGVRGRVDDGFLTSADTDGLADADEERGFHRCAIDTSGEDRHQARR